MIRNIIVFLNDKLFDNKNPNTKIPAVKTIG